MVGADEKPVYVGRTRRGVEMRLSWHRWSRRAGWLRTSNEDLARWLEGNTPSAIILDEVSQPGAEWPTEKAWIEKFSDLGIYNKTGNPAWSKRRGGRQRAAAA